MVPLEEGAREGNPILRVHPNYDEDTAYESSMGQSADRSKPSEAFETLDESSYELHIEDSPEKLPTASMTQNQLSEVEQNSRPERDLWLEQTNNDMDSEIVGEFQQHQSPKPITNCPDCNEEYTTGAYLMHLSHCKGLSAESSSVEKSDTENNRATKLTFAQTNEIENQRSELRWRIEEDHSDDGIPEIDPHIIHNLEKRKLAAARPPGQNPTPYVIRVI